jgi:adenylate cyclase
MAADVVGFAHMMERDEVGTLATLKACRKDMVEPRIAEFGGRIVKLMGDGALIEFASAVSAVECAIAVQDAMTARNASIAEERRVTFRIGINLGDVIVEEDADIYGDGVNVAARLEQLAPPGGVCIAGSVFEQIRDRVDAVFEDLGEQKVKSLTDQSACGAGSVPLVRKALQRLVSWYRLCLSAALRWRSCHWTVFPNAVTWSSSPMA